jgi:Ca-activated chloride channel family protein
MLRRVFLATPIAFAQDPGKDPPPIRVNVNLVNVPFSARNERGEWVRDLRAEDIEVLEDGVPQPIRFFSRADNSPLSIAIVADMSGSQEEFLKDHRRDLRDFLRTVMRPNDRATLICFRGSIRLVADFNSKPDDLDDALKEVQKARSTTKYRELGPAEIRDGASSVYDAVVHTAQHLASQDGRRAIILFSDGEDTSSASNLMDTIEAAQAAAVTVFTVRYTELSRGRWNARNKYGRSVMARMANDTGGIEIDATEADDLRPSFAKISDLLRNSYDLAYSSTQSERDGTFRKLKLRARNANLTLRHKTGYFARPE